MHAFSMVMLTSGLLLFACQESKAASPGGAQVEASAQAQLPAAATAGGARYSVVVKAAELKVGGKVKVELRINPAKGLKFNKDFPSKFIVNASSFAKCDKDKLTKRAGDIKHDGKVGVISIPLTGLAAGRGELSVIANFSVCNDEQCFVLRGEQLRLPVTVK